MATLMSDATIAAPPETEAIIKTKAFFRFRNERFRRLISINYYTDSVNLSLCRKNCLTLAAAIILTCLLPDLNADLTSLQGASGNQSPMPCRWT
jgi:hypothetical protein